MQHCDLCRQTADVHGYAPGCPRAFTGRVESAPTGSVQLVDLGSCYPSLRRVLVTDTERTDLLLRLGDALTANANLQHELTELTTECSRLDAELNSLAILLRPIAARRDCLCVRGEDGLYAHPRCTAVHDEECVGVVRLEKVSNVQDG